MSTNLVLPLKKDILVDYLRFVFEASRTGPIALNRCEGIEMINDHPMADFSIFFRRFMLIGDDIGIQQGGLIHPPLR